MVDEIAPSKQCIFIDTLDGEITKHSLKDQKLASKLRDLVMKQRGLPLETQAALLYRGKIIPGNLEICVDRRGSSSQRKGERAAEHARKVLLRQILQHESAHQKMVNGKKMTSPLDDENL